MNEYKRGYLASPDLERALARDGQASLQGGRYRAAVASAGPGYYEAWTDSLPFVYGRASSTLQGALDNLEQAVCEAESKRKAS